MNPPVRKSDDRFLVAFSFAGQQREFVRSIAELVEQQLGFGTVFFDEWFAADLAGAAADLTLQDNYVNKSELVVFCPSGDYSKSAWTAAEWNAIRARQNKLLAKSKDSAKRILPLRVADGDVEGLLENTIWMNAREYPTSHVADTIVARLRMFVPEAARPHVFLAETTAELEDEDQPVNRSRLKRFLQDECNCVVLPNDSLIGQGQTRLDAIMHRCTAFVQLLSKYPWPPPSSYDRVQYQAAKDAKCEAFRFRGEIQLSKVLKSHPDHHEFIKDSIANGFSDFKQHIKKKIVDLRSKSIKRVRELQREERLARTGKDDAGVDEDVTPLVRVAIRAGNADQVWTPIFQFLYENQHVDLDELAANETFSQRQGSDPCDGFLILCDEKTQEDEGLSPRDALVDCRLVQMQGVSDPTPPVAIVYWPPPAPAWPKLIRSTPKCLYRVTGDSLEDGLKDFLTDIRQIRSDADD